MSKKGRNTNNKLSIGATVGLSAAGAVVLWIAVAVIVGLITQGNKFAFFPALLSGLSDYRVWIFFLAAAGGIGAMYAAREMRSGKRVLKINDIEDTHWLTNAEVRANENMTIVSYSKLGTVSDGVPVYVNKQGRDMTVVFGKAIHTLVIGTTRSGKTTGFVDPTIQILCRTKTKPSMVITDPKGELYRNHAATLKSLGYDVLVLDIADPYRSARWNPFAAVIEKTQRIKQALSVVIDASEIKQAGGKYIDMDGVVHDTYEQAAAANASIGEYVFEGKSYPTREKAETARNVYIQDLKDEIFVDLQDVVYTVCPVTSQQEPVWEQGARNFIFALALAMWEDLLDGECEEREFNIHTLYKNVTDYGTEQKISALDEFLTAGRGEFSQAAGLAATVLSAQDRQLTSYLSTVQNYMVNFADSGIRRLTSGNDIDVDSFDDRPTALFLKIPDEKENRHFLVTLLITQLYKLLVNKARRNYRNGETKDEELKRNVYIIMDEFGNLPKFPNIRKILAVGASRKIIMLPIIQSYAQLDVIYGREEAAIIRDNSNIKIFIGSNDDSTIKEFSELCGKTKQRRISFGDGADTSHFSVNTSAESVPLIYPSELEHLNDPPHKMGNAVVLAFGKNPINAKFEPVFKQRKLYKPVDGVPNGNVEPQEFDEAAHYYNFAERSLYIARSAEFAAKQFEEAQHAVAELSGPDDPPQPFDPMDGADERLMPLMLSIKSKLTEKLGIALESAFFDHDTFKIIIACDAAMNYATAKNLRWLKAEAAKLKNIVKQLAARAPLEVNAKGDE